MNIHKVSNKRFQTGAETVEFMVTFPLFLLVFFMFIDIAITVYDRGTLLDASRVGNRQASLFWVDPLVFDPETPEQNQQLKRAMVDTVMTWTENRLLIDPRGNGLDFDLRINDTTMGSSVMALSESDRVSITINYRHGFIGLAHLSGVNAPSLNAQSTLGVE